MRIVLDTASFITAMRSQHGAARELLHFIADRRVIPCMDYKLSLEYRDVALRREQLEASNLSSQQMNAAIMALEAFAEPINVAHRLRPVSPRPKRRYDNRTSSSCLGFCHRHEQHAAFCSRDTRYGIAVLTPAQILKIFEKEEQHG